MTTAKTASQLHQLGSDLREQDQHFEAISALSQALVLYQQEGNYQGMVDTLKDRCLTWKHYFLLTQDSAYRVLAQKDAESMLTLTQDKNLTAKFATSYFRLGEIAMETKDYSAAVSFYRQALDHYQSLDAEKGDYTYHLGEALYRNGQKTEGITKFEEGIDLLKQFESQTDSFVFHVWLSGAYARLADLLQDDHPQNAVKYIKIAKTIAESDDRLVIRRRQINGLYVHFKSKGLV